MSTLAMSKTKKTKKRAAKLRNTAANNKTPTWLP
jgi:hypothetical protein